MKKPNLPMVIGSGPLADGMRAMINKDPDRYRPMTMSTSAVGVCPCCEKHIFRVTSRHTNWESKFSTGLEAEDVVHPSFDANGEEDPEGAFPGCCCTGPKHKVVA